MVDPVVNFITDPKLWYTFIYYRWRTENGSDFNNLSMDNIESISVLKDAISFNFGLLHQMVLLL